MAVGEFEVLRQHGAASSEFVPSSLFVRFSSFASSPCSVHALIERFAAASLISILPGILKHENGSRLVPKESVVTTGPARIDLNEGFAHLRSVKDLSAAIAVAVVVSDVETRIRTPSFEWKRRQGSNVAPLSERKRSHPWRMSQLTSFLSGLGNSNSMPEADSNRAMDTTRQVARRGCLLSPGSSSQMETRQWAP